MNILNVTKNDDGQFQISDASGHMVEGPFETNSAAWSALDRLDSASYNGLVKVRKPKPPAKRGKGKKKAKQPDKMTPKQEHRMKVNAAKAPGWIRGMAMGKFDPAGKRAFRDHKLGTFGAASEVKRIDPAVYLAEKAARGDC